STPCCILCPAPAATALYPLSLHDALPILPVVEHVHVLVDGDDAVDHEATATLVIHGRSSCSAAGTGNASRRSVPEKSPRLTSSYLDRSGSARLRWCAARSAAARVTAGGTSVMPRTTSMRYVPALQASWS